MLNLKSWMTKVSQWINQSSYLKNTSSTSITLYNCTGTVSNGIIFGQLGNGTFFIHGRLAITNFVRTSNNPGITFMLPDFVPTPSTMVSMQVGFRAESPRESVVLSIATGRSCSLLTNETYLNAVNGTLTFMVDSVFYI